MYALITASGIQEYIFGITHRAAGRRLRGRSARLGLVLDCCLQKIKEQEFSIEVLRNAGSRLEIRFKIEGEEQEKRARKFMAQLQEDLDRHSHDVLDAQVWFTTALASSRDGAYQCLQEGKFTAGKKVLQTADGASWNEDASAFDRQIDERALQRDEREEAARDLPESILGRQLVDRENMFFEFAKTPPGERKIAILDRDVKFGGTPPEGYGFSLKADDEGDSRGHSRLIRKHLCRYAPMNEGDLLNVNEIADRSSGASFLGVLKADLDNAGQAFAKCANDEARIGLSRILEFFFTDELERLLQSQYADCYLVYSGGDDLFLLGPWDELIRLAVAFQEKLQAAAQRWGTKGITLSAGFKLSHSASPVRHLADAAEAALEMAKRFPGKNRLAVFERLLAWDEAREGLHWAANFMGEGDRRGKLISRGFLQRLQYHASESRRYFEKRELDALHFIPLLHNDWERNRADMDKELAGKMQSEVLPQLTNLQPEKGERMWRIMDFASRFACYALRS